MTIDGVTEKQRLLAVGLSLLGVCGGAGAYITIRAIGRRASATHSVAYFSLYSTVVSAILMWFTGTKFVLPTQPSGSPCWSASASSVSQPRSCWPWSAARKGRSSRLSDLLADRLCIFVPAGVPAHSHPATERGRHGCHPHLRRLGCGGKVLTRAHSLTNLSACLFHNGFAKTFHIQDRMQLHSFQLRTVFVQNCELSRSFLSRRRSRWPTDKRTDRMRRGLLPG